MPLLAADMPATAADRLATAPVAIAASVGARRKTRSGAVTVSSNCYIRLCLRWRSSLQQ